MTTVPTSGLPDRPTGGPISRHRISRHLLVVIGLIAVALTSGCAAAPPVTPTTAPAAATAPAATQAAAPTEAPTVTVAPSPAAAVTPVATAVAGASPAAAASPTAAPTNVAAPPTTAAKPAAPPAVTPFAVASPAASPSPGPIATPSAAASPATGTAGSPSAQLLASARRLDAAIAGVRAGNIEDAQEEFDEFLADLGEIEEDTRDRYPEAFDRIDEAIDEVITDLFEPEDPVPADVTAALIRLRDTVIAVAPTIR